MSDQRPDDQTVTETETTEKKVDRPGVDTDVDVTETTEKKVDVDSEADAPLTDAIPED